MPVGSGGRGCLRGVFPGPRTPSPTPRFATSSSKVWRAARTGKLEGRTAGRPCPGLGGGSGTPAPYLPRPPSPLRRGRIRLSAAGVPRRQHPLSTLPSSAQNAAEAALSLRSLAARALRPPRRRRRRRGGREARPGRFARREGSGARRAPSCAASERASGPAWRSPSSGPSRRAALGGGGFLNRVQGARRALLLLLLSFLTPPSSQPSAPGNLGTVGEVGAARAARRPGLWVEGGEEREELRGEGGVRPRPRGAARSRTPLWAFVPGAAPPPALPGDSLGGRSDPPPLPERLGGAPGPGVGRWGERRRGNPRGFALPEPPKPLPACQPIFPPRDPSGYAGSRPRAGWGSKCWSPGLSKTTAHPLWAVTGHPLALPPSHASSQESLKCDTRQARRKWGPRGPARPALSSHPSGQLAPPAEGGVGAAGRRVGAGCLPHVGQCPG